MVSIRFPYFRVVSVAAAVAAMLVIIGPASAQTTITVNTLEGDGTTNGNCSLYEALAAASDNIATDACPAGTGNDTIQFSVTGTIVLTTDMPSITESVTIQGPGVSSLTIDGSARSSAILAFYGGTANVSDITFSGGLGLNANTGSIVNLEDCVISDMVGISVSSALNVYRATATLNRCTVSGNSGSSSGPIYGFGSDITIKNSTFSNNTSDYAGAVGTVGNATTGAGTLIVENSTFTGNASDHDGGAIAIAGDMMTATITSSTIAGNTADADANNSGRGGGINSAGGAAVTISNSIVAGNMDLGSFPEHDVSGSFTSAGYNLIGDCTGSCGDFASTGDQEGTSGSPIDPLLAALADNGGPTLTLELSTGSPAIDAGSCTGAEADQRHFGNGTSRIVDVGGVANVDDGCDIGAFEAEGVVVLPVELVAFSAVVDGEAVVLAWNTLSETNNAGFSVEMKGDQAAGINRWQQIAWVSGHATSTEEQRYSYRQGTLSPGTYLFRLKQIDFDGSYSFSDQIEVTIDVAGSHLLSPAYPNPFMNRSTFTLTTTTDQDVQVAVYDVVGRMVAEIHRGLLASGTTHQFELDGRNLPVGIYMINVQGETFSDNLQVVLTK